MDTVCILPFLTKGHNSQLFFADISLMYVRANLYFKHNDVILVISACGSSKHKIIMQEKDST